MHSLVIFRCRKLSLMLITIIVQLPCTLTVLKATDALKCGLHRPISATATAVLQYLCTPPFRLQLCSLVSDSLTNPIEVTSVILESWNLSLRPDRARNYRYTFSFQYLEGTCVIDLVIAEHLAPLSTSFPWAVRNHEVFRSSRYLTFAEHGNTGSLLPSCLMASKVQRGS